MLGIKLPAGHWWYDELLPLGSPGGFGAVFRGRGAGGEPVAVKRLQSEYQAREMRIADYLLGHGLAHVIPILDAGFDADAGTNFIVMPVAEISLQQSIDRRGPVGEQAALEILLAIAAGLDEIGDIIHRDLKPGNVLLHDGVWKLADLGLARFAEAATSRNTMRDSLTPDYAAPEQWRGERPTKATDVYALGAIMHALLRGAPPFAGPELVDFAHQHQLETPPALDATPHLRRLAAACLSKSPELRPSVQGLREQLETARAGTAAGPALRLAAVAAGLAERAEREREERLRRERELERLRRIATEAGDQLGGIFSELEAAILREAPNAKVEASEPFFKKVSLGLAMLSCRVDDLLYIPTLSEDIRVPFGYNGGFAGSLSWTVLRHAWISVGLTGHPGRNKSRAASLWFGQLLEADEYRWWEVSYAQNNLWHPYLFRNYKDITAGSGPHAFRGHYLDREHSAEYEDLAKRDNVFNSYVVAEDPKPVTPDCVDSFIERWIDLFALASTATDNASIEKLFPHEFKRRPVRAAFDLLR
nr:serine/threonine-protein kinase [uncultured Rhodopila sp.]